MTVTQDTELDLFVASKIGSFKHIKYHTESSKNNKKCIENLVDIKTLQKEDEVTCLRWGNKEQTEILLGRRNQQIQLYDTTSGFTKSYTADFAPGHIVGLGRYKRKLLAAVSSGVVRVWSKKTEVLVETGGKLDVMRVCDDAPVFATGGEENDLKVFDIGSTSPTFSAKNLSHDWLQLRRPVWVSGIAFSPLQAGRVLAVCSRHGYVRLYDSRAQRRPVLNVEFPNMAAACIAPSFDERNFLVGFGRGQLQQVELRVGRADRGFPGAAGAVSDVCVANVAGRQVVSVSLDRHLRVHDYHSKRLVYKHYLTSKLTCVLVQTETSTPLKNGAVEVKEEDGEETEDLEHIFHNMETVGDKKSETEEPSTKKMKPSTEGSTADTTDEAIAQLLRSTEKQKRKREKKKKEKRAKSVFHNA